MDIGHTGQSVESWDRRESMETRRTYSDSDSLNNLPLSGFSILCVWAACIWSSWSPSWSPSSSGSGWWRHSRKGFTGVWRCTARRPAATRPWTSCSLRWDERVVPSSWFLSQVGCCGVTEHSDWQHTQWGRGHRDRLPHSCCDVTTSGVCRPEARGAELHTLGCHTLITRTMERHSIVIVTMLLVTTLVHGAAVISSFCLARCKLLSVSESTILNSVSGQNIHTVRWRTEIGGGSHMTGNSFIKMNYTTLFSFAKKDN